MRKIAILLWLGLTGCAFGQFTIQKVDIVRVSTPIAVSVATTSVLNVSGSTVTVSGVVNVSGSTITANITGSTVSIVQPVDVSGSMVDVTGSVINDARYYNKVSTGSAGLVNTTGNITINGYAVKDYSFYADGGDVSVTGNSFNGTLYALDGIPVGQSFNVSLSSPVVFQCTLPSGTTLYWSASGEK